MLTHSSRTWRELTALSSVLFLLLWVIGTNKMLRPVRAQVGCSAGQTHITKKSGNGVACNPDSEVQFLSGVNWVPALIVDPNVAFLTWHTILGTQWNAMNCERMGPDNTHFAYRTTFTLPASFSSPSLSIQIHCDNAATIFLNGNDAAHTIGAQPDAEIAANFQDPPEVFTTNNAALFQPGLNTLSFDVHNIGAQITGLDFLADICFTPAQGCNDENPPNVTCNVAQNTLWPPNHDLECVGLTAHITDDCDHHCEGDDDDDDDDDDDGHGGHGGHGSHQPEGVTASGNHHGGGGGDDDDDDDDDDCNGNQLTAHVKVYSDEPDLDIPGSGNFSPDAKNIGLGTLRLRAERSGTADGRVYLIVVSATDQSGKTGFCAKTVTVTHDQSQASKNSVAAQASAARAYFAANHVPPPGYVEVGTGPVRGPKQ